MNTDISLAAKAVRLSLATEEAAIHMRHSARLKVSWNMAPAFDGLFYWPPVRAAVFWWLWECKGAEGKKRLPSKKSK